MFYPSCIHTHTEFCDGKNSMEEMARAAYALRFESLGFSPHSPLPYDNDWAMRADRYPDYFAQIAALRREYGGRMRIFCGIEWDYDTPSIPDRFDFVIGAVHSLVKKGECFSVDYTKDMLLDVTRRLYGGEFLELCADFYKQSVRSALRERVQIAAHFDLVTKYNKDGEMVNENDPEYLKLACAALEQILDKRPDLCFEINTGVMARAGKAYPYPSPSLLRFLCDNGAKLILTGDCHRTNHLGVGYDRVREILSEQRHPRLYTLTEKGFESVKL